MSVFVGAYVSTWDAWPDQPAALPLTTAFVLSQPGPGGIGHAEVVPLTADGEGGRCPCRDGATRQGDAGRRGACSRPWGCCALPRRREEHGWPSHLRGGSWVHECWFQGMGSEHLGARGQ